MLLTKPITTLEDMLEEVRKIYPDAEIDNYDDNIMVTYLRRTRLCVNLSGIYVNDSLSCLFGNSVHPQKILSVLRAIKDCE